jgi:hypothetical protein
MNPGIKMKRIWAVVGIAAVLMVVFGAFYVRTYSDHLGIREYGAVVKAAADYGQQLKTQGLAVPESVTLEELQKRGLLGPRDARGFEGLRVTISLKHDATRLEDALMSVTFPDGRELVALGDGSIQQRAKR